MTSFLAWLFVVFCWVVPEASAEPARDGPGAGAKPGNVLILVTDDQGVDQISAYGEHPKAPKTPNLDSLARDGVLFRNAWASPTCSPSRGALLTGRLPSRTGLGSVIHPDEVWEMPRSEVIIPRMLRGAPDAWSTAAIGKWHLAGQASENALKHPNLMGFDHFAGTIGNIGEAVRGGGQDLTYRNWEKVTNGKAEMVDAYATSVTVDDALKQIRNLPEPWLVYVAFNAPHAPWHVPPKDLHDLDIGPDASDAQKYRAMVMALDKEIGRLLDGMGAERRANTTIIYVSDNGTPDETTLEPWPADRAKNTPFEGGINVPMIVAGPAVSQPGSESAALVHVADVFATVADLAGVPIGAGARGPMEGVKVDGRSLVPLLRDPRAAGREVVFTEKFAPNGDSPHRVAWRISRNAELKIIESNEHGVLVYDVRDGRDEEPALPVNQIPRDLATSWQQLQAAHREHWGPPLRDRDGRRRRDGDGPRGGRRDSGPREGGRPEGGRREGGKRRGGRGGRDANPAA